MTQTFICPHGHQWEDTFGISLTADGTAPCPVCGAPTNVGTASRPSLFRGADWPQSTTSPPPGVTIAASQGVSAALPPTVPGYEIFTELGRGGMGVVYKAKHVALKRLVALKMILSGSHAGSKELARFRTEAEAVARLQHPNIVQVYEIGEHEGRPYFAMEFVEGGSLVNHVRENRLPTRQSAHLVATLARAMHVAHQKGIIHRDLKPANILLGPPLPFEGAGLGVRGYGTPKITDFGLAKDIAEATGQTKTGDVMGTPSYMAPEQAAGRLDLLGPAADIYALGAILYELLTARPPFKSETAMDTLLQVMYEDPLPPARLLPNCPRDLETICLKCLNKDISKRYATALELAEDLERYIEGHAIVARPISRVERVMKWAKRRPAVAALAVLSVLAPLVVLTLSLLYNVQLNKLNVELAQAAEQKRLEAEKAENERARAERQEHEANRRREEADRLRTLAENQRRRAEENFRKAREAVKLMLTEVGQTELVNVPLMEDVRQRLLAKAVAFHTEFLEKQSKAPTPRQQAGQAYMQLGDIYRMLGQYAKAESAYQDGLARFDELTREFPQEPDYRRDLALGRFHQGELARARNRNADAQAAYETARQMQAKLVAGFPKNADYRADLAHTLNDLALVQRNAGQSTAARDLYRQAIEVQQQLVKEHPDDRPEFREDLAGSWNDLGTLLYRALKEPGEAEKAYRAALTEFAALAERYPTVAAYRRKMAAVSNNLGNVLADQHGPAAGEKLIREALSHRQQLSRDFPSVLAYRQELALTHQNLAALLATDKKFAEAEKECLLGLEMQRKLAADFPGVAEFQASLAGMLDNLAALHLNQDRLDKALEALKEAQTRHPNAGDGGPARLLLRKHHLTRADTLLRIAEKDAGKHTEAAASAAELARLGADSAEDQRLAGVILARCTALVARDTKLADAERKPLAENYARRAVEMLGRAVQLGWSNAVELRTAAVYVPLRSRADFQKLLAELDKKGDK